MMLLTSYDLNALIAIGMTLVLGLAAVSLCRFERRCRDVQRFWNSPTGNALADKSGSTEALSLELTNLRTTVQMLQEAIDQLQQTPDAQSAEPDRRLPFDNAVRMAKSGATTDDLRKTCGLNIGEAHLLRKLHAARAGSEARTNKPVLQ